MAQIFTFTTACDEEQPPPPIHLPSPENSERERPPGSHPRPRKFHDEKSCCDL